MKMMSARAKFGIIAAALLGFIGAVSVTVDTVANAASRQVPASPKYVALGDSIASGAGLPLATNAATEDATCARGTADYPNLLAAKLKTTVTNLSCSGAKASDGLIAAQTVGIATVPSQVDRAFENGTPAIITITIGANDVNWVQFIGKCYVSTCGDWKDTAASAAYLTYFQGKLAYTLHEIKDRSGTNPPPKVLVTGYYNPVSSTSCLGGQVTGSELSWINAQTANLNKAIRQTITATTKVSSWFKGSYNFASYVPISFAGHGYCSKTPWVQDLASAAPLHPNATGAAQIANMLYAQIK